MFKKGECNALTHNVGANDHLKHLTAQLFSATRLLELGDFKRHRTIGTEPLPPAYRFACRCSEVIAMAISEVHRRIDIRQQTVKRRLS